MVSIVAVHQPELRNVPELDVLRYLLRHQVAVIVNDGHLFRVLMIQFAGGLRLEHEIWVDKAHGVMCFNNIIHKKAVKHICLPLHEMLYAYYATTAAILDSICSKSFLEN